jgi:signal transduction histidine kinase
MRKVASESSATAGRYGGALRATIRHAISDRALDQKLRVTSALGVAAVVILGLLTLHCLASLRAQGEENDRSQMFLVRLDALVGDLEHLQRTSRARAREPWVATVVHVITYEHAARNLVALKELVTVGSRRYAEVQRIAQLLDAEAAGTADLAAADTDAAADSHAAQVPALALAQRLQELVERTRQAEREAFALAKDIEDSLTHRLHELVLATILAGCLSGILLVALVRNDVAKREQTVLNLARTNDELAVKLKEHSAELAAANETLRAFSAHLEAAREIERMHIAREVHDALGSTLTALKLELAGGAEDTASGHNRQRASIALVDTALQAVRNVVTELRPCVLDKFGLWEGLAWQAEQFEERLKVPRRVSVPGELPPVPEPMATSVYRIVEEALTNVARHADASRVEIAVTLSPAALELSVSDDGRGMRQDEILGARSFGLLGMYERARMMGGEFQISGQPGFGTVARLRLPIPAEQGNAPGCATDHDEVSSRALTNAPLKA